VSGRLVEYSGQPSASAYLSLARDYGVAVDEMRRCVAAGKLNKLIVETRTRGESRAGIDPLVAYQTL